VTTIACDGKSMAGDSLITANGEIVGNTTKVQRTDDGRIFGASGSIVDITRFAKWMHGAEAPELSEDFCALILMPNGKVYYVGNKLEPSEYIVPQAIGSGADFAIGAMLAGQSPHEAVEIAMQRDTRTGGEITVFHIDPQLAAA